MGKEEFSLDCLVLTFYLIFMIFFRYRRTAPWWDAACVFCAAILKSASAFDESVLIILDGWPKRISKIHVKVTCFEQICNGPESSF